MAEKSRPSKSLHIRFREYRDIDQIEIHANRQGMKKVPWVRQALFKQIRKESVDEILTKTSRDANLEALLLLRGLVGPEAAEHAKREVETYINKVESDVRKKS